MDLIPRAALEWLAIQLVRDGSIIRVRTMHGGISCSVHEVWLRSPAGTHVRVVVRRYGEDWKDDPGVCGREFKLLELLAQHGFPAPQPLLLDNDGAVFGRPTVVMERLPGRPMLQPRNLPSYLAQLAMSLATLHAIAPDAAAFLPSDSQRVARAISREPARQKPLAAQVWDAVRSISPTLSREGRIVHGDFWPGNTVWYRDRLSGVIDWEMAALGSPARDVATCRCDLNNLFGPPAAEEFTRLYEEAAGARLRDLPFWDLVVVGGALRYIVDWSVGYRALGRADMTPQEATRRTAGFAEAALRRIG